MDDITDNGWTIEIIAVCKDGTERKATIIGKLVRGLRCSNMERPWQIKIKNSYRKYIDEDLEFALMTAIHPMSTLGDDRILYTDEDE